ncbi:hypothetical protein HB779_15855 [Phyllobacterium sp. 628]|uniref:hypothetical protein n=1 Tax=Phyllobacterium sp. 628 TaxID=2718938 RepID=UPI00166257DF|nr:hypothetical protein [Phyllobacterium sp. 628]QND53203.1 hypothetical protein HB779_15855 [Phyllobacterium sp. 628]
MQRSLNSSKREPRTTALALTISLPFDPRNVLPLTVGGMHMRSALGYFLVILGACLVAAAMWIWVGHDYLLIDPFWINWLIFTFLRPASIPQTFYDVTVGVMASLGIAAYSQGKYLLRPRQAAIEQAAPKSE